RGIKAVIENQDILIGSAETLLNQEIKLPDIDYTGRAIWVAVGGDVKGIIVIRDIMLAEMQHLADTIHSFGIEKVILATGDNEEQEAKRVAEYINADEYYFNNTPEDKTALVKKHQASGKVAMVGDGVNDAPALAAANVGIAIGGHKNVNLAITSSDIVILGHDAKDLIKILQLSQKMGGIIQQNYAWPWALIVLVWHWRHSVFLIRFLPLYYTTLVQFSWSLMLAACTLLILKIHLLSPYSEKWMPGPGIN
ncbi:MAG: hypothetical protein DRQ62_08720, partial [Gammaproteobacteria bacterium]